MSTSPLTQPAPVHSSLTRTQTPGRHLREQQPPSLPPRLSFVTVLCLLPRKKLREHSGIFFVFSLSRHRFCSDTYFGLSRVDGRHVCLPLKPLRRPPDQSVKLAVLAVGIFFFYYIKLHGTVSFAGSDSYRHKCGVDSMRGGSHWPSLKFFYSFFKYTHIYI